MGFKSSRAHLRQAERNAQDRERNRQEEATRRDTAIRTSIGMDASRDVSARELESSLHRRNVYESNLPPLDAARALSNIAARERSMQSTPTRSREFVGLAPDNVPRRQAPPPLPPTSDPEGYALARISQIADRDGIDRTQATITFGREEPDAAQRAMEAQRGKVTPAATSILGVQGQAAIQQFENRVIAELGADRALSAADAIQKVAAQYPDLARARNIALSVPVINGVSMVNA
jgi:hypothetical protein